MIKGTFKRNEVKSDYLLLNLPVMRKQENTAAISFAAASALAISAVNGIGCFSRCYIPIVEANDEEGGYLLR
jgi:hypothetical protein